MSAITLAQQAYSQTQATIRTDRATEAQLFGRITQQLRAVQSTKRGEYPKLVSALYENRRMWATIAAEVADAANALAPELRAQIFYLAEFTERHSQMIMRGEADVDALIDVNTAVMRGLNSRTA
ncbi:flagellar biosynthesis regulator FlaF [Yoonia litorea]|uniref:Flagellar protein FlaF n=1 Tax=Yoonia litorea TaxID=1123755 RepID=A0A1I6MTY8_9RHOB|nr:flagellar biosynthesis regulator FlaF [Yoonia litorea]SFS19186.1 flagellar protein FlaF [Yoonia litorea]